MPAARPPTRLGTAARRGEATGPSDNLGENRRFTVESITSCSLGFRSRRTPSADGYDPGLGPPGPLARDRRCTASLTITKRTEIGRFPAHHMQERRVVATAWAESAHGQAHYDQGTTRSPTRERTWRGDNRYPARMNRAAQTSGFLRVSAGFSGFLRISQDFSGFLGISRGPAGH